MRQSSDKCLLCNVNEATQKNSHLIPKFFGQALYYGTNPRHSILISKNGYKKKVQDIVKEDYLFCKSCEMGFSIYETYCSLRLSRFDNLKYHDKFQRITLNDFEYFESIDLDIRIFNLFVYSIVWRVSISENLAFKAFSLNDFEKEKLRLVLLDFSKTNQEDLLNEINKFQNIEMHYHVFVRPNKLLRPPNSMLSAASYNDILHQINLVDYVLLYSTSYNSFTPRFKVLDNNRLSGRVKIGLIDKTKWINFNKDMFNEAMKE